MNFGFSTIRLVLANVLPNTIVQLASFGTKMIANVNVSKSFRLFVILLQKFGIRKHAVVSQIP